MECSLRELDGAADLDRMRSCKLLKRFLASEKRMVSMRLYVVLTMRMLKHMTELPNPP